MSELNRRVRVGLLYGLIFGTVALVLPFFPIYLSLLGLSPSRIGLVLSVLEIAALAAPFILPRFADRSGYFRMVMLVMILGAALSFLLIGKAGSFAGILAASMMLGFFYKPLMALADAYSGRVLADPSTEYGRVRVWGTVSFLCVSLASQVIGFLYEASPRRFISVFLISMGALAAVIPLIPGVPAHTDDSPSGAAGGLRVLPGGFFSLLGLTFLGNMGLAVYNAFGSLYFSQQFTFPEVSGLMALAALPEIPVMLASGRFLKSLGHRKMLAGALAASVLRMAVLAAFPHRWPMALTQLSHGVVFVFFLVSCLDWLNKTVPARNRAFGIGLFMAVSLGAAQLVGSALGGVLLEFGGFSVLFMAAGLCPLAGLIWLFLDRQTGTLSTTPGKIR